MLELLRARRSVRDYTAEPLSQADLEYLQEAMLRSPSSRGLDPWQFVFVTDKRLLGELAAAKAHGSRFLRNAALGVVILGDESVADTWIEDCSIASIILQLTCQSRNLGSCWIQIRLREHGNGISAETYIRNLLRLPEHLRVESIISIGHPASTPDPHPRSSLKNQNIHTLS